MTVLLVRHARAGRRDKWRGDDRLRPLTARGRAQAAALPALVAPWLDGRRKRPLMVSSPWLRCAQTLDPLAEQLRVDIATDEILGEGMGPKALASLGDWMSAGSVVLCTHGDVIEEILADLARHGADMGRQPRTAKGSVWVLCGDRLPVSRTEYLSPA